MTGLDPKSRPLRIRLPYASEGEFEERYAANVARGGVFIATRMPRPVDTALVFEFVLADGATVLEGEGVVMKIQADGARPGMTVRFAKLSADARARVERMVARRQQAKSGATKPAPEATSEASAPNVNVEPAPPVGAAPVEAALVEPAPVEPAPVEAAPVEPTKPWEEAAPAPVEVKPPSPLDRFEAAHASPTEESLPTVRVTPLKLPKLPKNASLTKPETPSAIERSAPVDEDATQDFLIPPDFEEKLNGPTLPSEAKPSAAATPAPAPTASALGVGLYLNGVFASGARVAEGQLASVPLGAERTLPTGIALNAEGKLEFTSAPPTPANHLLRDALPLLGKRKDAPELKDRIEWGATPLLLAGVGEPDLLWQGQSFNAMALAITVVRAVKTEVERASGLAFAQAVLAVPLALGEAERRAWRHAATSAGFDKVSLINLSSAVTLAYAHGRSLARKRILCLHVDPFSIEATVAEVTGPDAEVVLSLGDFLYEPDVMTAVEHFFIRLRQALELQNLPLQKMDAVIFSGHLLEQRAVREMIEHLLGTKGSDVPESADAPARGAALWADRIAALAQGQKALSLSEVLGGSVDVVLTPGPTERLFEQGARLPAEKTVTTRIKEGQELEVAFFEGPEQKFVGLARVRPERNGETTLAVTATSDGLIDAKLKLPGGKEMTLRLSSAELPRATPRDFAEGGVAAKSPGLLGGLSRIFRRPRG